MTVPYIKAHGAGNDFLFTWKRDGPTNALPEAARAICSRRTGVGADGWYLVEPRVEGFDAALSLYNSDGSAAELSGNGTRCAAAVLVEGGLASDALRIRTGAGERRLHLLSRDGYRFYFEMVMGVPTYKRGNIRYALPLSNGPLEVSILDVGNSQCAVFVKRFPDDWSRTAAEIEGHSHFPKRTNVSFVRVVDEHTLEARFYERGAGETLSSGTGATGAAVAAMLRGLAKSPVRVLTVSGRLDVRWDREQADVLQAGEAVIVARGEYYLE
jgi:diaminopimelate epimerase